MGLKLQAKSTGLDSVKSRNGQTCAHCGRLAGGFAAGFARGFNGEPLCHPNEPNRPNCYVLVTTYNHPMPCTSPTCFEGHADQSRYYRLRKSVKYVE